MATLKDYEGEIGDRIFVECVQRAMGGDSKKLLMAYAASKMPDVCASSIRIFIDNVIYFSRPGIAFGFGNNSATRARLALRSEVV